jgi:hypothetical protein
MSVSIHWHSERRAEILWLYDESVFHLGIGWGLGSSRAAVDYPKALS